VSKHVHTTLLLVTLGFCLIPAQTVVLREFLFACGGNELITGIFLANWMMLTGLGALLGRFKTPGTMHIPYFLLLLAWMPLMLLLGIDALRNIAFDQGIQLNLFQVFLFSFFLLLPFCLLSGYIFLGFNSIMNRQNVSNQPERAYAAESAGSLAGGILFSFILSYWCNNYQIAGIVALLSSFSAIWFSGMIKTRASKAIFILVLIIPLFYFAIAPGNLFGRSMLFENQDVLLSRDSPYGNLTITRTAEQLNIYENYVQLYVTNNQLTNEESVHFAMIQHRHPENILIISGGIAGLTKEVLKYISVKSIDYLEINPLLFKIGRTYTKTLDDARIREIKTDPRVFLHHENKQYDVVIVGLPEPSSLQLNRFYSLSFFTDVRRNMSDSALLTFSLPASGNYLSDEAMQLNSSVLNTCKKLFRHVVIFPGEKNYFVASQESIKTNIAELVENKGIDNVYVNFYYINDQLLGQRINQLDKQLSEKVDVNTDFKPVLLYQYLRYWINQFSSHNTLMIIIWIVLLAVTALALFRSGYVITGIFTAGFTSSALQVVLLVSFQIVYGYFYQSIAAFVAVFMGGLSLGAMFRPRLIPKVTPVKLIFLQGVMAAVSCLVPAGILLSGHMLAFPAIVHAVFFILLLLVSGVTGMLYSNGVNLVSGGTVHAISAVYGADLIGAAFGAVLVTLVIIPYSGILNAAYLLGVLNILISACMWCIYRLKG
jgi:spermidine synthase